MINIGDYLFCHTTYENSVGSCLEKNNRYKIIHFNDLNEISIALIPNSISGNFSHKWINFSLEEDSVIYYKKWFQTFEEYYRLNRIDKIDKLLEND